MTCVGRHIMFFVRLPIYLPHKHKLTSTFTLHFLSLVCCVLMAGLNSSRWLFLTANKICPQGQIATLSEVGGKL